MSTYIEIDRVTPREWQRLHAAARALDLEMGGLWDERAGGALNLWASPEDKPAGWPAEVVMRRGALTHPRAYVAFLHLAWPEDRPDLTWVSPDLLPVECEITIYDAWEWRKRNRPADRDAYLDWARLLNSPAGYRVDGDEAWVRAKFAGLRAWAAANIASPFSGYN